MACKQLEKKEEKGLGFGRRDKSDLGELLKEHTSYESVSNKKVPVCFSWKTNCSVDGHGSEMKQALRVWIRMFRILDFKPRQRPET